MNALHDSRRRPTVATTTSFGADASHRYNRHTDEMMKRALSLIGPKALTSPKEEAARHEAGHAVIDTALGDEVRSISVFRLAEPEHKMLIASGIANELWGGATFSCKTWQSTPYTTPIEDLRFAQRTLGGWLGE